MDDPFQNLQARTGHTMPEWLALVERTGLEEHTEIIRWPETEHGVRHGVAKGTVDEVDDELLGWLREAYARNQPRGATTPPG